MVPRTLLYMVILGIRLCDWQTSKNTVEVPRTLPYTVILGIRLCDWSEEGDCMIRPANLTHVKAPKTLPYMDILRMALKEEELGDKSSRVEFSKGNSQI